jgi:hypothetical protein
MKVIGIFYGFIVMIYLQPGMMDTVLNLGINDEVVERIIAITENAKFAYGKSKLYE